MSTYIAARLRRSVVQMWHIYFLSKNSMYHFYLSSEGLWICLKSNFFFIFNFFNRQQILSCFIMNISMTNSSIGVTNEAWFIPFDLFRLISNSLSIIFAVLFLLKIILDKTCHTVPMMLVANTCVAALLAASFLVSFSAFALHNDVKQIIYEDLFCVARAYMKYSVYSSFNYSFMLQSLYRYVIVIYPTRLLFQSFKFQASLISMTWTITLVFPLPFILVNSIIYDANNQICMVPFRLSFSLLYLTFGMYILPISMTMLIYLQLFRYVHGMNRRVTSTNVVNRAQRELRMVQRTVILITILLTLGSVMIVFVCMSLFIAPPKYYFRFGFLCADPSLTLVMIVLYHFTDPLKVSIQRIDVRTTRVLRITRWTSSNTIYSHRSDADLQLYTNIKVEITKNIFECQVNDDQFLAKHLSIVTFKYSTRYSCVMK